MSFSDTFENTVMNWAFTTGAVTRPTAWYIALFTVAPGETGGGTEVTGGSYARMAAGLTVSGSVASNAAAVEWAAATASWGTVVAAAVFDALSGGNMLAYGTLTASKTINSGDIFRIPASQLSMTLN